MSVTAAQLTFLGILLVTFGLLMTERVRTDMVAVLIILALAGTGLLSSDQALSGFGSEPAITIAAVFVLGAGLRYTGVSGRLGAWIGRIAGGGLTRMLAVLMPASAAMSAFTHHVAITAVLLPVTLSLSREKAVSPSKLLIPLAVGSSLGTCITTITPSFLVASELLRQSGRPGLGLFAIAPLGLAVSLAGIVYMLLVGRWLLPDRRGSDNPAERFRLDGYVTELRLLPGSKLVGSTIRELQSDSKVSFSVLGFARQQRPWRIPVRQRRVREGDVLLVRATPDELVGIREDSNLELEPLLKYEESTDNGVPAAAEDEAETLVQAVVAPRSSLIGRTIADVDFRRRYGVLVLGLWRRSTIHPEQLGQTRLREGDVLVLRGSEDALARVRNERDFLLLVPFQAETHRPHKALLAGAIMLGTIVLASSGWKPLPIAMMAGAAAMLLTKCLTVRQAYRAIDAPMYLFVAGAIPLGAAMTKSGTADLLAGLVINTVGNWREVVLLFAVFVIVGVVVQFMGSDSATTAVFGPMVIALAQGLSRPPEAYVVTVAVAAVTATLTPMAHHNLVIYRPGGYRFLDYTRIGAPLTLLIGAIVAVIAPRLWSA